MELSSINNFYKKYKNVILFNKSIVIAAIITAIADIFIVSYASYLYTSNYLLISVISLVADFIIYNFSFIILYFIDNNSKYKNEDGSKNRRKIREDIVKLITVIGFAEISYLATKFLSTYLIFESIVIDPSLISVITTVIAWLFYATIANIMAKKKELFD